jgi:hypothetical protein
MKKTIQWIAAVALMSCTVQASLVFTDNFTGSNCAALTNTWVNTGYVASPLAGYNILSNKAQLIGLTPTLTYNTTYASLNDGDNSFTAEVTAQLNIAPGNVNTAVGLAINAQDATHYYGVRLNGAGTVNVYQVGGRGPLSLVSFSNAVTFVQNRAYRFVVSSDTPYTFNISVADTENSANTFSTTWTDTYSNFKDGYAGLYSAGNTIHTFDDFSITVIPEPSTVGLFVISGAAVFALRRKMR